jgi:Amt family ammonium transporter
MKDRSMRRTLLASAGIGLIGCLLVAGSVYAQTPTTEAAAAAPAAAAAAPIPNKGDTAWMLVSSALVLMMSIPGLALFYGGLVRTKNMLSVLTQVFTIVSLVGIVWCLYG